MKKHWMKKLVIVVTLCATLGSVSAHSTYRTFNINPFSQTMTASYSKTDTVDKVGVSLSQAGTEEVRDVIHFVFQTKGYTALDTTVVEGETKTTYYKNGYGSTVSVTFGDNDYNIGAHTVKGTLYW